MADVKFSQFPDGGQLQPGDIIVGLRGGVNTQFDSPTDAGTPFLLKAFNLSDVANAQDSYVNLGTGNGKDLTIQNADLPTVTLTNPCENRITVFITAGPLTLVLPPLQEPAAFSLNQGFQILVVGIQVVTVKDSANNTLFTLQPGDSGYIRVTDATTPEGQWSFTFNTLTVNTKSGNILLDEQSIYDFSTNPEIALATDKHFGFSGTAAGFYLPAMTAAQFDAIPTPPTGLLAYNQDDDRIRINKATPGAPIYDELAYVSDITSIVVDAVYAEVSFQGNATPTNIVTMGVPVQVNGTYVPGDLFGFSQAAGVITFTTAETREVVIEASLNATMNLVNANVTFTVFLNGAAVPKSAIAVDLDGVTPSLTPVSVSCLLSITLNDTIAIFVQNNSGTDDVLVQDINFKVSAIGGTGASSTIPTWEQTYTAGDGTVTMTTGKPIDVQSADNAIIPDIRTTQTEVPVNGQVISNFGAWANGIRYGMTEATVQTLATHSQNTRYGLKSGLNTIISRYTGNNDTEHYSSLLTQGGNNQGVNTTVATVTAPVENYGSSTGTFLMWTGIAGTPQITANSFAIGDTIEIDLVGTMFIQVPDAIVTTGASGINITVGAIINITSASMTPATFPTSYNESFALKFKITRVNGTGGGNGLMVAGSGVWRNTNGTLQLINFTNGLFTTAYVSSSTYPIAVNFVKGSASSTSRFDLIAYGLNIKQYS